MRVVIIGAGFSGLSSATRLADEDHHVTLLHSSSTSSEPTCLMGSLIGNLAATRAVFHRLDLGDLVPQPAQAGTWARVLRLIRSRPLSLVDRASAATFLARVFYPTTRWPSASDFESTTDWLDRHHVPSSVREALCAPIVSLIGEPAEETSAKLVERVLRDGLSCDDAVFGPVVLHRGIDLIEPTHQFLKARSGSVRTAAVAQLIIEDHAISGVQLADGEVIPADLVVVDAEPTELLRLVPLAEREREPYFEALTNLDRARAHGPGGDAARPRCRTPVGGLFYASAWTRTGLPISPEGAAQAVDEVMLRLANYQPPTKKTAPKTSGNFIPLTRIAASSH